MLVNDEAAAAAAPLTAGSAASALPIPVDCWWLLLPAPLLLRLVEFTLLLLLWLSNVEATVGVEVPLDGDIRFDWDTHGSW